MTLPPSYNTSRDYLSDCLNFLKTFQWLYNYNNTHIVAKRILNHFPFEWVAFFKEMSYNNLNTLLEGETKEDCPESLKDMINRLTKLKPKYITCTQTCDPRLVHNCGLNKKKLHEIISLAPLIDTVCRESNANVVLDVGAGLGYLSHLLHDNYNYSVLGVECSSRYVDMAYRNQQKFYPNSKNHVDFVQHYVDERSIYEITTLLEKQFSHIPEKIVCITGLHACADLSITILDLFAKLEFVKCLVIMPCCYHRIQLRNSTEDKEYFKYFPASELFKELFEELEAERFIARPFLRLACQQAMDAFKNMSEDDHERHSRNCMYRAVLQDVAESENCRVKRLKRKSGKNRDPNSENDFKAYLDNLKNTHVLERDDKIVEISDEKFQQKMSEKWNEHKNDCHLIEILTGFQAAIQSVCENVVLLDRVEFLKEKGFECSVNKVTDEIISPRCYAIVACKK